MCPLILYMLTRNIRRTFIDKDNECVTLIRYVYLDRKNGKKKGKGII